jgi:hypothetical protein
MNIVGAPRMADMLIVRVFTKAIAALTRCMSGAARPEVAITG